MSFVDYYEISFWQPERKLYHLLMGIENLHTFGMVDP
jgi:hypothetical protein